MTADTTNECRDAQERVTAAIWAWRDRAESKGQAETRKRRKRSLIQSAVMLAVGLLLMLYFKHVRMSIVVFSLAAVVFMSGHFVPAVYDRIERSVAVLVRIITVGITWVLLAPFFYLCFVPGKIVLLLMRKDPLHRKFPSGEKSYWTPHRPVPPDRYERQY